MGTILPDADMPAIRKLRIVTDIGMPDGEVLEARHAVSELQVQLSKVRTLSLLRQRAFEEVRSSIVHRWWNET